jgi:alpha-beta hydrolase superfamily lysophospholipase
MNSFDDPTELVSPTGATLNLYHMAPGGDPRAIVQINHGVAEHAARYGAFARFLAQRGFAMFAHDHRGHGKTRAPDAPTGIFAKAAAGVSWRSAIDDVLAVHDQAAQRYPGVPVITFGHSMGGMIAMNFALSHPRRQAALAVWNSNFHLGLTGRIAQAALVVERMTLGSDVPSRLLPKMTFETWGKAIKNARTPFDWLSHDEDQVQAYIDDPMCGWDASVALWQDIFAMGYRACSRTELAKLPKSIPINLVGGGLDPATDQGKAVTWYAGHLRRLGFENVTNRIYDGLRHETLNESAPPGAEGAMEDFAAWASQAVKRDQPTDNP